MPSLSHRQRRSGLRHVLADTLVAADEPERIAELRALVATLETPADRLLARYRGRPDRPLAGPRYSAASW